MEAHVSRYNFVVMHALHHGPPLREGWLVFMVRGLVSSGCDIPGSGQCLHQGKVCYLYWKYNHPMIEALRRSCAAVVLYPQCDSEV